MVYSSLVLRILSTPRTIMTSILSKLLGSVTTLLWKPYSTHHSFADMETNRRGKRQRYSAYTGGFRDTSDVMNEMSKKMKEKVIEKKVHVKALTIWIKEVVGIDPPSSSTLPDSERVYQVVCWVDGPNEKEVDTFESQGPDPKWLEYATVCLDGHPLGEQGFLNVEVLRFNSMENLNDPGTSDGPSIGAVSRVRIPLPTMINERIERRCELVKHDGYGNLKIEGSIVLAMRLEGYTYY